MGDEVLANLMQQSQVFPPDEAFVAQANATADLYGEAEADREAFWEKQAERLHWETRWNQVLDWSNAPFAKWFVGGRLNVAYNCVDRHVENGYGDQVAIHWVGEPGDTRDITYAQLKDEVCKAANALSSLGLKPGDRVAIQMPMIPEAIVSMLACARLGLVHSVVFGGFSPSALRSRVEDADAKVVITTDGQYRRGKALPMKANVDEGIEGIDPETGRTRHIHLTEKVRQRYAHAAAEQRSAIAAALRASGAAHLRLRTDRDWVRDIAQFVVAQRRTAHRLARHTVPRPAIPTRTAP